MLILNNNKKKGSFEPFVCFDKNTRDLMNTVSPWFGDLRIWQGVTYEVTVRKRSFHEGRYNPWSRWHYQIYVQVICDKDRTLVSGFSVKNYAVFECLLKQLLAKDTSRFLLAESPVP